MSRIAITGAGGFIGQALVAAARAAGHEVVSVTRHPGAAAHAGVHPVTCDLGHADAIGTLGPALANVDAVIHAAARLTGDEAAQKRDTIAATDHLVSALQASGVPLTLISSLSVYDVANLTDGATLDETGPLVQDAAQRDTYAAIKAQQERRAQVYDGPLHVVRPGAVYGPGRLWSAQLGFAKAGRIICPDGTVPVPAIHVDHLARTVVPASLSGTPCGPVNLIDPAPPTQADWVAALGMRILRVSRPAVLAAGRMLGRGTAWSARFRPLRYDITRAEQALNHRPARTFAEAVKASLDAERGAS